MNQHIFFLLEWGANSGADNQYVWDNDLAPLSAVSDLNES